MKNNIIGFPENQAIRYNFDFLISVNAGIAKTSITVPFQFKGMSEDDILMITQLSLSMFESTPVFASASKRKNGINFVPNSFSNQTLRLVLIYNPDEGYDLSVELPNQLEQIVGQEMIAIALHTEFEKYEQELLSSQKEESTEDKQLKTSGLIG